MERSRNGKENKTYEAITEQRVEISREKSIKSKADSLTILIKSINLEPGYPRKKERRHKLTNIRNERGITTTDPVDFKRVIKDYCEQLCVCNRPIPWKTQTTKTHAEEIGHLKRPVFTKEIESIINNLPKQKHRKNRLRWFHW